MSHTTRFALVTAALLSTAAPAAAQDQQQQQWLRDLQAQAEALAQSVVGQLPGRFQADRDRLKADKARRKADRVRAAQGPEYTDRFSKTVHLGQKGELDLSTIAGDITVTATGGEDVKIDAIKRVHGTNESEARAALKDLNVQVDERPGLLEVRTDFARRGNFPNITVDYTVAVPTGTSLTLHTISGDVQITGVRGDINSSTASGDTMLHNIRSRSVEVESVSGDVSLDGADSDRVDLKSVSGDIGYTGRLTRNGRYEMQSHSGDIHIVAQDSPGFDIEASTFSGDIRSDYPLTIRGGSGNSLVNRGGPGHTVRGSFGDASAVLTLRSFSGDIAINKK